MITNETCISDANKRKKQEARLKVLTTTDNLEGSLRGAFQRRAAAAETYESHIKMTADRALGFELIPPCTLFQRPQQSPTIVRAK